MRQLLSYLLGILWIFSVYGFDYGVITEEYRLPAKLDAEVLSTIETEVWASVYRPKKHSWRRFPLIVMLHGNHATCGRFLPSGIRRDDSVQYTFTGDCPDGYVVVPNHRGYEYVAKPLARRGYIVVSINANRGINGNFGTFGDWGLNLARGRLVLRHLGLLSQWNRGILPPPIGLTSLKRKIDFKRVGFMGHSRGGEGMRAALQQLRDPGNPFKDIIGRISIKAVFEIGPVDGQTSRILNADGVSSIILLPSCDSDVSSLEGHRVFDRVFQSTDDMIERPKGTFTVTGANHNSYNTEWQESEASGCNGVKPLFQQAGPSEAQQLTLTRSLIPFMNAYVRGFIFSGRVFDPAYPIPPGLRKTTFYERGHLRAPPFKRVEIIQKFSGPSLQSDAGLPNQAVGVDVLHESGLLFEHEFSQRAARVKWNTPGTKYYQITLSKNGINFRRRRALSLRVAVGCGLDICNSDIDESPDIDLRLSLIDKSGKRSQEVVVNRFYPLRRPTGPVWGLPHDTLQTVDLPVRAFRKVRLRKIVAIRVRIASPREGVIHLAQITTDKLPFWSLRFNFFAKGKRAGAKKRPEADQEALVAPPTPEPQALQLEPPMVEADVTEIEGAQDFQNGTIQLTLTSNVKFPITNSLPLLLVGENVVAAGAVEQNTSKVVFPVGQQKFTSLPAGQKVEVAIGGSRYSFQNLPAPASLITPG